MYDYFYGQQAELFSFYRVPKVLFTDEKFSNISSDAKLLYGIMLDRMNLSAKNGWVDELGRVYIIFTIEEVKGALGCAEKKAVKLLHELENKCGLIERKRIGLGKPNYIYVKNFVDNSVERQFLNTDPEQFIKNIEDETFYGVPFTVVLYRDEQGNTIPQDFLSELDPPPKGFRVEDAPVIDLEEEAPSVDEAEESPFVAQVMRDVEAIAAEEESYERFSVIETENGYAVWDDIRDEIYVDDEGVSEEFTSEWQANDYLQEVKKAVSAKESAEWLYNERSKFEATQEPVYQVGDTVFLEGEAYNITAIGTTDVQLLPPGMVYPIYRAESKENFERLLRQDERNARFISGEEPEKTVATAEPEHFMQNTSLYHVNTLLDNARFIVVELCRDA